MTAYIARRLVHMVPVLFLITLFVFFLVRLVPGDPASVMLGPRATPERIAALKKALNLDDPYWTQYVTFMRNLARGDLGDSVRRRNRCGTSCWTGYNRRSSDCLRDDPLRRDDGAAGDLGSAAKGRLADRAVRVFVILSLGMPAYWVGMMLLQIFAVRYRIFPVSGWGHGVFGHLESLFCRLCRWRWRSRR